MKLKFLIAGYFISCLLVYPQKVIIKGNAPSYAGDRIFLYGINDWITKTDEDLGYFDVDKDGNFSTDILTDNSKLIYFSLFAYKGFLYVEPYTEYEILLPPKEEKEIKDKLNPYFIEPQLHIGILNTRKQGRIYEEDELNMMINS